MARYEKTYRRSLEDPDGFWREAAEAIGTASPQTGARRLPGAAAR